MDLIIDPLHYIIATGPALYYPVYEAMRKKYHDKQIPILGNRDDRVRGFLHAQAMGLNREFPGMMITSSAAKHMRGSGHDRQMGLQKKIAIPVNNKLLRANQGGLPRRRCARVPFEDFVHQENMKKEEEQKKQSIASQNRLARQGYYLVNATQRTVARLPEGPQKIPYTEDELKRIAAGRKKRKQEKAALERQHKAMTQKRRRNRHIILEQVAMIDSNYVNVPMNRKQVPVMRF
eukprot:Trichotokara_eunicae@DN9476_c0_g1_i1.p1